MTPQVLLIRNGVNNLTNKQGWQNLLVSITKICDVDIDTTSKKPFPLLYEEIFLKSPSIKELNLTNKTRHSELRPYAKSKCILCYPKIGFYIDLIIF